MDIDQTQKTRVLTRLCLSHCPHIEAIYLFGSWATQDQWVSSDVDIALLLPVLDAKAQGSLYVTPLHQGLETLFSKDIDLINLRLVSTIFQKEIIGADRRIYCADAFAADSFEMLVMSFYQKLNEERADIMRSFYETKRAISI